jgi:hypothetical protein
MANTAYTRSVRITLADGTKVTRKSGLFLIPKGQPLPQMTPEIQQTWVRAMAVYEQPVTDVRFTYRKR